MTYKDGAVSVPVHDISYAMDEILEQLRKVQDHAVDPAAVQHTIDRVVTIQREVATLCCNPSTMNCEFEVERRPDRPVAVGE